MSAASDKTAALETGIGHAFADPHLLDMALTHSSVPRHKYNNERLEFLGHRVLGLAIADMLYKAFPQEPEGDLAKRLTALVQQEALVKVAEALALGAHVKLSSGEIKAGGGQKDTILADAVEALIGAIYLDGGYAPAAAVVEKHWRAMLSTHIAPPEDAKTKLQEWAQAQGLPLPEYKVLSRAGSDHHPVFEIEVGVEGQGNATAKASSKRLAEKEAAAILLAKIENKSA